MTEILKVLYTAALSFAALFLIAKLMGKKQIAQLEFIDYAVGISIGSIAAQMAVDSQIPFYHFLIAMAVYMLLDLIVSFAARKLYFLKILFKGKPIILIENGNLLYKNIKKSKLDLNEFLSLCRIKQYFNINDIDYCIFETNGELSILPKSKASPIVCEDMNIQKEKEQLSIDFIMDGKIVYKALKQANKTEEWLLKKLNIKENSEIKNIAIATYDSENDGVIYFTKK